MPRDDRMSIGGAGGLFLYRRTGESVVIKADGYEPMEIQIVFIGRENVRIRFKSNEQYTINRKEREGRA